MMIIVIGHMVTIPTVLAVSEIATNRRVAGGGAYFIISRSFGTTIGGSIGIALYLSQAISIAFYLVAFAEAFQPLLDMIGAKYGSLPTLHWVSIPGLAILVTLMLTKGADQGVRVLWFVCAILAAVIGAFLLGSGPEEIRPDGLNLTSTIANPDGFGVVFAQRCRPASVPWPWFREWSARRRGHRVIRGAGQPLDPRPAIERHTGQRDDHSRRGLQPHQEPAHLHH